MSTVTEAIESLRQQKKQAEADYARLVKDVAGGGQPAGEALAVLALVGKSMEQFQLDCQEAAAAAADAKAQANAGRLSTGLLREANGRVTALSNQHDAISNTVRVLLNAVGTALQAPVDAARSYANQLNGEVARLHGWPNKFAVEGRRAKIRNLESQIKASQHAIATDPMGAVDHVDDSRRADIRMWQAELAELRAKPIVFTTEPTLPAEPAVVDLQQVGLDALVNGLRKAIPADQQADLFGVLVKTFSEAAQTTKEAR